MESKADPRSSYPVDNLSPCSPFLMELPGALVWGTQAVRQENKHFKDGVVGFTFLQWEELESVDQQVAVVYTLCVLLG